MMFPPLSLEDLSFLLAISAILLLVSAEIVPHLFGEKTLVSDIKRLRDLAIVTGVMFLVTVAITIFNIIFSSQT